MKTYLEARGHNVSFCWRHFHYKLLSFAVAPLNFIQITMKFEFSKKKIYAFWTVNKFDSTNFSHFSRSRFRQIFSLSLVFLSAS